MRLDFFIPGEPPTITAQEKGLATRQIWSHGRTKTVPYAYEIPQIKRIKEMFIWQLGAHRPERELDGPIRMITIWTWEATRTHKAGTYRDTKPDTDNIIKLFKDAMADCHFFPNDSRICDERTIKRWGTIPGIRVILEEIGKGAGDGCEEVMDRQQSEDAGGSALV